LSEKFTDNGI
jgi:C4-dicarboxylate transporter